MNSGGGKRHWLVVTIILSLVIVGMVYQDNQDAAEKVRQQETQARLHLQDMEQDSAPRPAVPAMVPETTAAQAPEAMTASDTPGTEPMNEVGEFLADPINLEMIRQQQRETIQAEYAVLFQELQLTPDERGKLLGILVRQHDRILSRFARNGGNPETLTSDQAMVAEAANELLQIRDLLGEKRFEQYRKFQQTLTQAGISRKRE